MKRSTKTALQYMTFVWFFTTCLAVLVNCAPPPKQYAPEPSEIVAITDPCGTQSDNDEVVVELKDGSLYTYRKDRRHQYFSIVGPGYFVLTDGCGFTIDEDNKVKW